MTAMTIRRLTRCAAALPVILLVACSGVPGHVVPPEKMASLMADMRMADAVISVNGAEYRSDSARLALRQAVLDRNGVTAAQFDTSLVWYGHNISRYQDVTDRSIEILEGRLIAAGSSTGGAALSVAGDSVDVWTGPETFAVTRRSPSEYITFDLKYDRNWEPGDEYIWRLSLVTVPASGQWGITAEYADEAVETETVPLNVSSRRNEITFRTDSTRRARRLTGWLRLSPDAHHPAVVDSVSLVRRRAVGNAPRNYRQILYEPQNKDKDRTDATDTIPAVG